MSYEANVEPRFGRVELAYADPRGGSWAMIVLVAALTAAGLIVVPLSVATLVGPHHGQATEDLAAGFVLGAMCLIPGAALLAWSVRERRIQPEWYLCENGMVRMSKAGTGRALLWRELRRVAVVHVVRTGRVIGYRIRADKRLVFVPNEDAAKRAYELWARANHTSGQ